MRDISLEIQDDFMTDVENWTSYFYLTLNWDPKIMWVNYCHLPQSNIRRSAAAPTEEGWVDSRSRGVLSLQGRGSCTEGQALQGRKRLPVALLGDRSPASNSLCVSRGRPNCIRLVPWARIGSSSSQLPFPRESLWAWATSKRLILIELFEKL